MRLPTNQLPQNQYGLPLRPKEQDLVSSELFPEVSIHLAQLEASVPLQKLPLSTNTSTTRVPTSPTILIDPAEHGYIVILTLYISAGPEHKHA
jgi:hypothetical protein